VKKTLGKGCVPVKTKQKPIRNLWGAIKPLKKKSEGKAEFNRLEKG